MPGPFLRKYGVAATIPITLFEVDGVDMRVDAVAATGDIKITKDEGAEADTSNLFVDEGSKYSILLTATEMQAARISGILIDQTVTKVWLDTDFLIETYGNASAQHAFDLGTASVTLAAVTHTGAVIPTVSTLTGHTPQTGDSFARIGVNGAGLTNIDLPNQSFDLTGNITGNLSGSVGSVTAAVTVGTINANVINATSIATAAMNGKGDWNIGKTGYSLTITPPTAVENRQEMDGNSTQLAAIVLDTGTTLPDLIDDLAVKKNTTFSNFEFLMVLTSDGRTPATGLTVTGQRSIDGGAFVSVAGAIAEVSNGIYQFDALAADTNGDVITWRFSSATADDTFVTFKTVA